VSKARGQQQSIVVVLGEDDNDRQVVCILVSALRPELPKGSLKPLRKPMALVRKVPPDRIPSQTSRVSAVLRAQAVRFPIRAVLMHEDADDVEPAHQALIKKVEDAFRPLPWPVLAVVPAWETEAWWFLFPEAVRAVHRSWRLPDQYTGKDVGKIRNAKEQLRKAVRPAGARANFRSYEVSDSPRVAEEIVAQRLLSQPPAARSASWQVFLDKVKMI
jgi:hypothetical protein